MFKFFDSISLRAAILDGVFFCLMLGFGDSFINPYAVHLHASPLFVTILATVPPLVGAWSQMFSLFLLKRYPNRKVIMVLFSALQGFTWFLIGAIPLLSYSEESLQISLLVSVCLHQIFGNLASPPWNSLIGDLVPSEIRGEYFGYRNRFLHTATLISLFTAGALLNALTHATGENLGFLIIFSIAATARIVSAWYLSRYEDIPYVPKPGSEFSFLRFIRKSKHSNFAQFAWYQALMNGAVVFQGPLIAVVLLKDFHRTYFEYSVIMGTQLFFQLLMMPRWGKLSDLYGNKIILTVSGFGVSLIPFFWLISSNIYFLITIHMYAGIMWAGFSLAAGNFLFDAVTPAKRARCAAFQTILTTSTVCFCGLFVGYMAEHLPDSLRITHGLFTENSPYYLFFLSSGILRLTVALSFVNRFYEVREVTPIHHKTLLFQVMGIRGSTSGNMLPISEK